jgi:ferredoxin
MSSMLKKCLSFALAVLVLFSVAPIQARAAEAEHEHDHVEESVSEAMQAVQASIDDMLEWYVGSTEASEEEVAAKVAEMDDDSIWMALVELEDLTWTMEDTLTQEEQEALVKVRTIYQSQHKVPCTACAYCVEGCPAGIPIPDIFGLLNKKLAKEEDFDEKAYAAFSVQADACVGCGACESACPQKLQIRKLLEEAHKALA